MIHEWVVCDLNSDSYFLVLLIFFVFSDMFFVWAGRRVWVHIAIHARRSVHTIHHNIYTFYIHILGGLFVCCFFVGFYGVLYLLLVCRSVVRRPLPDTTLLQYVQCYMHGWWWWYDGWEMKGFAFLKEIISYYSSFCWKISPWVND